MNPSKPLKTTRHKQQSTEPLTAFYESILNNAGYAMITTDVDGLITLFNPAAERLLGYKSSELVGQYSPALFHDPLEVQHHASLLSKELNKVVLPGFEVFVVKSLSGLPNQDEWTYICKNGTRLTALLEITALLNPEKKIIGFLGIASDITIQRQLERALQVAREELSVAIELSRLGVWTWNLIDNSLYWNDRMFSMYEYPIEVSRQNLNYQHWQKRLHPDDADIAEVALKNAVEGRGEYNIVFRLLFPDGHVRYIHAAAKVFFDRSGKAISVSGMNIDVTDQYEYQRILKEDRDKLDVANKAKSEFLANMSHEIRTPMSAIIGLMELLSKTKLDVNQLDYVRKSQATSEALLAILSDILDFSKIESNKLELDLQSMNLDRLMHSMTSILSVSAGEKPIELLFDIDPTLPKCILVDGLRLRQILLNLVSNAVKFTERGEIIVSIKQVNKNKNSVTLHFSISDTGIGIPAESLKLLFQSFSQAESSIARRYGGTGLGLAISKRLVQLMGGELCIESKLNAGSNFYFTLKFKIAQDGTSPDMRSMNKKLTSIKCLLIDDNASARAILGKMLAAFGWHVEAVSTEDEAISLLSSCPAHAPFTIIYVDYRIADVNGWSVCERIRALNRQEQLFIVMMCMICDSTTIAGHQTQRPKVIDGILIKPITPSSILDLTMSLYYPALQQNTPFFNVQPELPRLNGVTILLVEDNPTNQIVAHDLLVGEGATVIVAGVPHQVLDTLDANQTSFDVILMDIQMPEMDGYTLTQKIREKYSKKQLAIIAMSANIAIEYKTKAFDVGMNDYVSKPFKLDELVGVIQRVLGHKEPIALTTIDEQVLSRFGGNKNAYRRALASFITDIDQHLNKMPIDFVNHDEYVIRALHTLKGLAGTMGFDSFAAEINTIYQQVNVKHPAHKRWLQWRAQLKKSGLAVLEDARTRYAALLPEKNQPIATDNYAPLLHALIGYLETNNMKAIDCYLALQQQGFTDLVLNQLINNLDFAAAAAHCRLLSKP